MILVQILHFWILINSVVSNSTATADEIIEKYEKAKPLIDYVDVDTYKEFVREGTTTFIFYGADWCHHCRQYDCFHLENNSLDLPPFGWNFKMLRKRTSLINISISKKSNVRLTWAYAVL